MQRWVGSFYADVGTRILCIGGHTPFYAEVSRCFVYKGGQALFYEEMGTRFFMQR